MTFTVRLDKQNLDTGAAEKTLAINSNDQYYYDWSKEEGEIKLRFIPVLRGFWTLKNSILLRTCD